MSDIEVVARRRGVLEELTDGPVHKRDLTERIDASRSTVDRAVRELADAGLVERRSGGYAATLVGRFALERFTEYRRESEKIFANEPAVDPLPANCELPLEFVTSTETKVASDPAPYRPMRWVHEQITAADEFRMVLPVLYDPRFLERCYEHAVEQGNPTSLVVDEDVLETANEDFPDQTAEKAACGWFSVKIGQTSSYGLLLTTCDGETTATAIVFGASLGPIHSVLSTTDPGPVQWAERRFERAHDAARSPDKTPNEAVRERSAADGGQP